MQLNDLLKNIKKGFTLRQNGKKYALYKISNQMAHAVELETGKELKILKSTFIAQNFYIAEENKRALNIKTIKGIDIQNTIIENYY